MAGLDLQTDSRKRCWQEMGFRAIQLVRLRFIEIPQGVLAKKLGRTLCRAEAGVYTGRTSAVGERLGPAGTARTR
jgi:hypothetical protein